MSVEQQKPTFDEKGLLQPTLKKVKQTRAEKDAEREFRCNLLIQEMALESKVSAHPDAECRAVYWLSDTEHGAAINMYLVDPPILSKRMRQAINEYRRKKPERHRILGYVSNGILGTVRDSRWHYHRKLGGMTFSLHMLLNAKTYGFAQLEIEKADEKSGRAQRLISVAQLLECPRVKSSCNYEEQVLFKTDRQFGWGW